MNKQNLTLDKVDAYQFLSTLGSVSQTQNIHVFQTFDDNESRKSPSLIDQPKGTFQDSWPQLERLNKKGAGIFVTINETGGRDRRNANITHIRAIFCDDDGDWSPPKGFPKPHLTVRTSSKGDENRYQKIWLVSDFEAEDFQFAMSKFVEWGSDPNAKDLARVLRIPGTFHCKEAPSLVLLEECVTIDKQPPYKKLDFLEFIDFAKASVGGDQEPRKSSLPYGFAAGVGSEPAFARASNYIKNEAPKAIAHHPVFPRDSTAFKVACRMADFGVSLQQCRELLGEWNTIKVDDPLPETDLDRISKSAFRNRKSPLGCDNPTAGFDNTRLTDDSAASNTPLFRSAARWVGVEPKPTPFLFQGLIPLNHVTLLHGDGGVGKSLLALQMMTCVASGKDFLDFDTRLKGSAVGLFKEDDENENHKRLKRNCESLGVPYEEVADRIFIERSLRVDDDDTLWDEKGVTKALALVESFIRSVEDCRLLVLDNVSHLYSASEIDRGPVTKFIDRLSKISEDNNMATVLVHHDRKPSPGAVVTDRRHAAGGSAAWTNRPRATLNISDSNKNDGTRLLDSGKANRSEECGPVPIKWNNFAFHRVGSSVEHKKCHKFVRTRIAKLIADKTNLSPSPHASNWAAKVLEKDGGNPGFSVAEIEAVLEAMVGTFLRTEKYGKPRYNKKNGADIRTQRYALIKNEEGYGSREETVEPVPDSSWPNLRNTEKINIPSELAVGDGSTKDTVYKEPSPC